MDEVAPFRSLELEPNVKTYLNEKINRKLESPVTRKEDARSQAQVGQYTSVMSQKCIFNQ